jgi:hypothetical protein
VIRISFYFLLAAVFQSVCCADVTKLAREDRTVLQDSPRFHELHSGRDLPSAIITICDEDGKLADPGQNWNATDSITDPSLPAKRLIWGAVGGEYYVLHYERGGIAHTYHILVATLVNNDAKPKVVWRAVGGPFKNCVAFVDALRSGKLDDRLRKSKFW